MQTVRIVSFARDVDGGESYIRTDPVNIGIDYEMSMKFKTLENDGLLFYVTDDLTAQVLTTLQARNTSQFQFFRISDAGLVDETLSII